MEELFKTLNIKEINYLFIDYIDNHGDCKTIKLEHLQDKLEEIEKDFKDGKYDYRS